jgi:hypothetical protein
VKHLLPALLLVLFPVAAGIAAEPSSRILDKVYASANEHLMQGRSRQAAEAFRVVADAVPELPEPSAAAALALALSDWSARANAVPYVRRALAAEPANPIAGIVAAIVDPALSALRSDGGLYLTPWGVERVVRAGELLGSDYPGLRSGPRPLARFAASGEATGDAYFPKRIPRFSTLMREASFGAMFVVDVPPPRFAVYDSRIIASMRNAVANLATNQRRLEELRARLGEVRTGLVAIEQSDRAALAERRAAELEASAAEREQRLAMIETRQNAGASAEILRRERAWIDALRRAAAEERRRLEAIRAGQN